MNKGYVERFACAVRNWRARQLFKALRIYCRGAILDVGGWDFYLKVRNDPKIKFETWTNLESTENQLAKIENDPRYKTILGDGCKMALRDSSFDTVINIQVLEHVFEPIQMVKEIGRVLRPNGYAIFLIPGTSVLHMAPEHYYNFTRFWIKQAVKKANLSIVEFKPIGGLWNTTATHLFRFFFQSLRLEGYSTPDVKRNLFFYLFYPLMVIYAIVNIPINLFLGWGDLTEDANNFLVVAKKSTLD
ncbi:MAG: type 11 methyltransferase [Parcubacteria group bacterium Gr01-1014_3]|nr:MAG: type 11 methyltransferase [Parcubacteria group bacterium Gr01-1014_3]